MFYRSGWLRCVLMIIGFCLFVFWAGDLGWGVCWWMILDSDRVSGWAFDVWCSITIYYIIILSFLLLILSLISSLPNLLNFHFPYSSPCLSFPSHPLLPFFMFTFHQFLLSVFQSSSSKFDPACFIGVDGWGVYFGYVWCSFGWLRCVGFMFGVSVSSGWNCRVS